MSFSITNLTKEKPPRMGFEAIKNSILGESYDLNAVIVGSAKMKELNYTYRKKNEPTDILSFPLSQTEGEIYICPEETRTQAPLFGRDYENFFAFLFVHGCTHLKGYDHGRKMEMFEAEMRRRFGI